MQARRAADAGAIVLVPLGATEQHGPHLPLATDTLHAAAVSLDAAARVAARFPVLVAPALPYGCSAHHIPFGGTVSLTSATYLRLLGDIGDSLAASGFSRVFFVNGHGGNHQLTAQSAADLSGRAGINAAAASWWHLAQRAVIDAKVLEDGAMPGHAGAFETSIVLALRPELVADTVPSRNDPPPVTRFGNPLTLALRGSWERFNGYSDSPRSATPVRGVDLLELGIAALAEAIEYFAQASGLKSSA